MTYTPGGAGLPDLPISTEVETGRQVNGEDTFFKVIESIGALTAGTTTNIAHGITGMARAIDLSGVATTTSGIDVMLSFGSPAGGFSVSAQVDGTNISLNVGSGWSGGSLTLNDPQIFLEYTKT